MVGITQVEARHSLLFELVGAEANPRHPFAELAFRLNAGSDPVRAGVLSQPCLQLVPFQCGQPPAVIYSTAMLPRFSATERFITNTKNATANVNTAAIQKQSK